MRAGRYIVTLASQGYDMIMLDMTPANVAFAKRQITRSGVQDRVKAVVEGSIEEAARRGLDHRAGLPAEETRDSKSDVKIVGARILQRGCQH